VDDAVTWSLIIPAIGIGYAVQNPDTPYLIFLVLALLCGFGGGNFASSMSNISFFFPKRRRATRWRSMPASAIWASASCSSSCRW
jgi:nitrate/nitrite transporter NarK